MVDEPKIEIRASAELKVEVPADVQREVIGFAQRLFGPLAELGDVLSDRIRFFRLKQTIWVLNRAREMCAEAGIEPKQIPLNVLLPLLEKASLEDDGPDSLREQWASLLANAAGQPDKRYAKYSALLEELDSYEAELLTKLKGEISRHELFKPDNIGEMTGTEQGAVWGPTGVQSIDALTQLGRCAYSWHEDDIPNTNEFSLADLDEVVPLLHLHRLGLVKVGAGSFLTGRDADPKTQKRIFYLYGDITPLGFDFVAACEKPDPANA